MSKNMKLLMENFNKFLQEEDEMDGMEMESDIDNILDDILGDMLEEGMLKEMFPTPEDVKDGDDIMSGKTPSKEEVKSDIKKALKAPEVKTVLDKMSEEALKEQDIQAGIRAAIDSYGNELKIAAASIPGLSILGAVLGNFNEPADAFFMDPAIVQAITSSNMKFGAVGGAVIGAAFLSIVVVDFFKRANSVKKSREDKRDYAEFKKRVDDKLASDAAEYRARKGI